MQSYPLEVVLLVVQITMVVIVEMIPVSTLLEIVLYIGVTMAIQVDGVVIIVILMILILENAPIY